MSEEYKSIHEFKLMYFFAKCEIIDIDRLDDAKNYPNQNLIMGYQGDAYLAGVSPEAINEIRNCVVPGIQIVNENWEVHIKDPSIDNKKGWFQKLKNIFVKEEHQMIITSKDIKNPYGHDKLMGNDFLTHQEHELLGSTPRVRNTHSPEYYMPVFLKENDLSIIPQTFAINEIRKNKYLLAIPDYWITEGNSIKLTKGKVKAILPSLDQSRRSEYDPMTFEGYWPIDQYTNRMRINLRKEYGKEK